MSLNITLYLCCNVCNVPVEAIPRTTNLVEMRVIDDKTLINLINMSALTAVLCSYFNLCRKSVAGCMMAFCNVLVLENGLPGTAL